MLRSRYFDWMYHLVCNDKYYKRLSYQKLLRCLDDIEFTYTMELDGNRAADGIDFRYRFGYENGYSIEEIEQGLDYGPCSVLEMMVALAFRVEEQIMDDPMYGNRIGQWFWSMIVSLNLGSQWDDNFDEYRVRHAIERFLNRDYERNGKGGLFTLEKPHKNLRNVEIWTQFMWYLNEVIDDQEGR